MPPTGSSDGGGPGSWHLRVGRAEEVMKAFHEYMSATDAGEEEAARWLSAHDPQSHVGSRHHTVPRFLLERWADASSRVQTYSRIEERFSTRNIRDLAIRDFYTFISTSGDKDSSMESILGEVEGAASEVVRRLLSPFVIPRRAELHEVAALAQFAAFQVVRTSRHRREAELHAEWLAKTMAQGRVPDVDLRDITVVPHQNEAIEAMGQQAQQFFPLFACRPVALVVLKGARLLIGDEPVLINPGPDEDTHHADCFLTDAEFDAKLARERRKKKGRRRQKIGRVIHFSSTAPRGLGVAPEIVLPISPTAALLWGPLREAPYGGDIRREHLDVAE